jgi:serine/threonine protein kinase
MAAFAASLGTPCGRAPRAAPGSRHTSGIRSLRPCSSPLQPARQWAPRQQFRVSAVLYPQPYVTYAEASQDHEELGWRTDFASHYRLNQQLGQGSFGSVHSGADVHTVRAWRAAWLRGRCHISTGLTGARLAPRPCPQGKSVAVKVLPKTRGKLSRDKTLEKLAREVGRFTARLGACAAMLARFSLPQS